MPLTTSEFRDACAYLTGQGQLAVTYERIIDANNQQVWDRQHNSAGVLVSQTDITPNEATLTQALTDLATQITNEQNLITQVATVKTNSKTNASTNRSNIQGGLPQVKTEVERLHDEIQAIWVFIESLGISE